SPRESAAEHHDGEFARYPSPRSWWQVATLPDGEPVGFVVPAHNGYNAIIAYLGVLPAHRGHGYVDEILAEGTRILAASGAPRVAVDRRRRRRAGLQLPGQGARRAHRDGRPAGPAALPRGDRGAATDGGLHGGQPGRVRGVRAHHAAGRRAVHRRGVPRGG